MIKTDDGSTSRPEEEPTLGSMWGAASQAAIDDDLLEWPPDVFALTDVVLERSEAYRFALPGSAPWPPIRSPDWSEAVTEAAREWCDAVERPGASVPDLVAEEWRVLFDGVDAPVGHLIEGGDWRLCEALLTLHAVADEACAGLAVAVDTADGRGCLYRARGRELLVRTGSLARIPQHVLRVLPKLRTLTTGTSARSLSRYACVVAPGVEIGWYKLPARYPITDPRGEHANLLLLPWPLRVRENDFRPVEGSVRELTTDPYGFFEFAPAEPLDFDLVERTIAAAREEVSSVDVVMLPESAVDETDVDKLERLLDHYGVTSLITGVRQRSPGPGRLPTNWVHIGVNPRLEKGRGLATSTGEEWFHIRQNKHHRWSLDENQVYQYNLGGVLHPQVLWWEAMEIPRRSVQFLEVGEDVTLVSLVCEDLAQNDNVAEVVRSVGPTVVTTVLLDGPQLTSRWAARYASVLADDPGSAILTLTSFGMVQRCRPRGRVASPVVALWKDPVHGTLEIPLEGGADGIVLTICGARATRRSSDGRLPAETGTHYFDVAVHQVSASTSPSGRSKERSVVQDPPPLSADDVSILTAWAEAVAEALTCAPERIDAVLADAAADASWRSGLGIAPPSPPLSEAMEAMGNVVRTTASKYGATLIDALIGTDEDQWSEPDRLAARVLRSRVAQRRSRQGQASRR
jgi:hypothetical protein